MDEQYRMLGHERQADLLREAQRFALADQVSRDRKARGRVGHLMRRGVAFASLKPRPAGLRRIHLPDDLT